jgi:hypothetical protein
MPEGRRAPGDRRQRAGRENLARDRRGPNEETQSASSHARYLSRGDFPSHWNRLKTRVPEPCSGTRMVLLPALGKGELGPPVVASRTGAIQERDLAEIMVKIERFLRIASGFQMFRKKLQ